MTFLRKAAGVIPHCC